VKTSPFGGEKVSEFVAEDAVADSEKYESQRAGDLKYVDDFIHMIFPLITSCKCYRVYYNAKTAIFQMKLKAKTPEEEFPFRRFLWGSVLCQSPQSQ
jgi:hypothetical protein